MPGWSHYQCWGKFGHCRTCSAYADPCKANICPTDADLRRKGYQNISKHSAAATSQDSLKTCRSVPSLSVCLSRACGLEMALQSSWQLCIGSTACASTMSVASFATRNFFFVLCMLCLNEVSTCRLGSTASLVSAPPTRCFDHGGELTRRQGDQLQRFPGVSRCARSRSDVWLDLPEQDVLSPGSQVWYMQ